MAVLVVVVGEEDLAEGAGAGKGLRFAERAVVRDVRDVFLDPQTRAWYVDWPEVARSTVAALRAAVGAARRHGRGGSGPGGSQPRGRPYSRGLTPGGGAGPRELGPVTAAMTPPALGRQPPRRS